GGAGTSGLADRDRAVYSPAGRARARRPVRSRKAQSGRTARRAAAGEAENRRLTARQQIGCSPNVHRSREQSIMTIREYLAGQAQQITERARPEFLDKQLYQRHLPQRRREYAEMMGLDRHLPDRSASVNVHVTGVVERPGYRIEKLYY